LLQGFVIERVTFAHHPLIREILTMANETSKPITIDELEAIAKTKLPQNVYDYYACGSDDQKCLRRNRSAFDRYA
jgi:hypothetical protein